MSTKFLSPGWRMPRNANKDKLSNYSIDSGGTTERISFTSSIDLGTNSTISLWAKFDSFGGVLIGELSYSSAYLFYIDSANIYIRIFSVVKTFAHSLSINQWYNIIIVRNGDSIEVFVNNTSLGTQTGYGTSTNTKFDTLAHKPAAAASHPFKGDLNQVSGFDYALSSNQISSLYNSGLPINPMTLKPAPIAYYPLGTSAWNGNYLAENNAIGDYVFDFIPNDYIDCGTGLGDSLGTYTGDLTLSYWFNTDSLTANKGLFYIGSFSNAQGQFQVNIYNNNMLFRVDSGNQSKALSISSLSTGTWYHIGFIYKAGNISDSKVYLNGVEQSTTDTGTFPSSLSFSGLKTIIGGYYGTNNTFDGKLSNVQIFNTELSSTEVETLYNYGSPIKTLANIPQSSNLKAWYKLDASEVYNSTTTEWSVDNNQNPSAYASSLDFDSASSDYIQINNGSSLTNGFSELTVSVWANFSTVGTSQQQIITKDDTNQRSFNLRKLSSGVNFLVSTDGTSSSQTLFYPSSSITIGEWYHFVGIYDGSKLLLYVNGVLIDDSVSLTGSLQNTTSGFFIGSYGFNNSYTFDGSLSNASIWNTALTSAQVTELYNNGTPSNLSSHSATSNLVSWWKLNNTTTGIEDAKGSNDGTNNGATEYPGFVNVLAGESSGMTQANLVQSDLQTVAPYSKYAMDFDGTADYIDCGDSDDFSFGDGANDSPFSYSTWVNMDDATSFVLFSKYPDDNAHTKREYRIFISNADKPYLILYDAGTTSSINYRVATNAITSYQNQWINLTFTYDGRGGNLAGDGIKIYLNGSSIALDATISSSYVSMHNTSTPARIGRTLTSYPNGKISNCSLWNTALTSAQVSEIYNEGLPGNLNSHSAYSNLISWWQLGENSSFDGNDWIVADEKGTNNGTSVSMPVGALVNGVGTTANGVSSGMSEGNLVGDAPYSTANAISTNMVVTSRVTGSGNTP